MHRFSQIITYFVIFAAGATLAWIWNIPVQHEAADLHAVVDESNRRIEELQAQIRAQQAELAALRKRPLAAPLTMKDPASGPAPEAPAQESIRGPWAEQSTENKETADVDEKEMPPATEETALARLHQFLEDISGMRRRDRRKQRRKLVEELREMGEPAVTALLQLLEEGATLRERRSAVRLLGILQDPAALPALQNVLSNDEDVIIRRNAARSLRRLQIPESIPALEAALNNPEEDHFVRINAARGLAQLGEPQGVNGLLEIYAETDDGRVRFRAFRALHSLDDTAALPLMRQGASTESEVSYRLRAVRFLGRNGSQEDLALLQQVLAAPNEQPSVVEAAQKAYSRLSARELQPR